MNNNQSQNIINLPLPPKKRSLIVEFLLGGVSTGCACILSNPMEVVKTRMQLQVNHFRSILNKTNYYIPLREN